MTKGQLKDLETIEYFIPRSFTGQTAYPCGAIETEDGDSPEQVFFDQSDKGIPFKGRKVTNLARLEQLIQGKRWRGITIHELWEQGLEDVPYIELLKDMPASVKEFLKKEMFKGAHAELIERVWQKVNLV